MPFIGNKYRIYLKTDLVLLFFIHTAIWGQGTLKPWVVNYSRKEYRADHQNWSVDISKNGLLYFGNNAGLVEFDGSNWFRHEIAENMVVRSVAVGNDGKIYTGAYEEFGYWTRDECGLLSYHSLSDSLDRSIMHNDEIWRIVPFNDRVYFQSFSNLFYFDGSEVSVIRPGSAMVLLQKAGQRLFIHLVDHGLCELVNDSLKLIPGSRILAGEELRVVLPFDDSRLLVGSGSSGLYLYDGISFTPWNVPANREISTAEINVGLSMDDFMVFGTIVNGIFIVSRDGHIVSHLNSSNLLQNNTVLALKNDSRGNIWACLDQGISCIQLNHPVDLYPDAGRQLGSVYTAAFSGGILWIGSNQGLFRYKGSSADGFTHPVMVPGSHGQVWNLRVIDGQLIMGHTSGTYRVGEENELTKISDINGGYDIRRISAGDGDYLIQSTYSNLVIYEKLSEGWKFRNTIEGFLEPVSRIEIDHFGHVWAVHNNRGVFRVILNESLEKVVSVRYLGREQGFPNDRGLHIARVENRILFPTGHEIYTYDDLNDTIIPYSPLNEKLGEFMASRQIIPAGRNRYWCIMEQKAGLFSFSANGAELLFQYDFELPGFSFITSSPNIVDIDENSFLFCLDNGFAILREKELPEAAPAPSTVVMSRAIATSNRGKKKYLPLDPHVLVLPTAFRKLDFSFSSPGSDPHLQFRCRLAGLEDQWREWGSQSRIEYTRLKHGHYIFHAESKNFRGQTGLPLEYMVSIKPPWTVSTPGYLLYGLVLLSFILFLRWSFLRRLALQTRKLEERDAEKRLQEKLLAEQKIIRLKNENLEKEISYKNRQLANYTFNIIHRNQTLIKIREEILKHRREADTKDPSGFFLQLLKLVEKNLSSEDDWKIFESHFDAAHQDFLKRLIHEFPDLTPSDLRLCAYLRMNLSSKEIAPLLNITVRGVEIRRYRLRKRLGLKTGENLTEFILGF